jgi:hypothetical protein
MAIQKILMKIRTAIGYDTLLPKTTLDQVYDPDTGKSADELLEGKADLDSDGKLPIGQLPGAVTTGGLAYQGTFNAATGQDSGGAALPTPSAANKGYYWVCDTAGTFNGVVYNPKDWAVSHGDRWDHVDNSDPTLAMMGCVYTTCSTAAGTAAKATGTIAGFVRGVGGTVAVGFTSLNTAAAPTLNVSGTGAAAIRCEGAAAVADMLPTVGLFEWDGTYWQLLNPAPSYAETTLTLAAASWTGSAAPYTYTISTTAVRITPKSLQVVKLNSSDSAVAAAAAAAEIDVDDASQAANTIVLKAYGTKPTVGLPVKIISLSDRI